ncbi:MAG TPA: T9SS type A sorting domain-containing protein [Ignavibacteria bacterium]|nr:T9SS type A sorting domain-containing protein [Ignavibacteria bacterium]HMR38982.1 T9SS type A sorting domain-containing protein [Ignavibacteria bacterium]
MKTIKVFLLVMFTFLINDMGMSYLITVNNICPSQQNPTPFYYPTGNININYKIDSAGSLDRGDPICRIYLVQRGVQILMYDQIVPKGQQLSTPLNPENLPGLKYNEPVTIKITAISTMYPMFPYTKYFYFIIYRDGNNSPFFSLSNGSVELLRENVFGVFFSSEDCESVASGAYYLKQYKITFTIQGDFTDSIPDLVNEYSLGYPGSLPNPQNRWAYVISRTDNEIKFGTFVYRLGNILGQDLGYVPCRPEEARVVFRYDGQPNILYMQSYPALLTPSNHLAIITNNTSGYYDSSIWSDSNNIQNHQMTPYLDYAILNANMSGSTSELLEYYSIHLQVSNNYFNSNSFKFHPIFGQDPQGCPAVVFKEKGIDVTENHILTTSLANPGSDVDDFYLTYNPFNADKDTISFNVSEKGNDITKIDLLKMYQIEAEKNTEAAVTVDGQVINFENDQDRNKVITNHDLDVSEELRSIDNITYTLDKDSVLKIIVPPGDENYLVIRGRTKASKEIISFRMNTSLNENADIYLRELPGDVCIKLDKPNFTSLTLTALQKCEIDRIALVKDLNTNSVYELDMIPPPDNQRDFSKIIAYDDNNYLTVGNGRNVSLSFLNKKNMDKDHYYYLKINGSYIKSEDPIKDNAELRSSNKFKFKLHENYPNPFNPSTIIRFEIPENGHVKLSVYDITGRLIRTIVDEFRNAGAYESAFDGSSLSSGFYFYRLESGRNIETNRMILLK